MTAPPDAAAPLEKVAIIAGGGALPLELAEACRASGRPYLILAAQGFADAAVADHPHEWIGLAAMGRAFRLMREAGCEAVILAGIISRPDFTKLKPDMGALVRIPRIIRAARGGDNQLLSLIVSLFEEEGFRVMGQHEVMQDLLAGAGPLGRHAPQAEHLDDMRRGIEVVRAMGELDIGQGAVVCRRLVLAVEAAEGTDAMLARCADLPPQVRGTPDNRRGVFVKLPKPAQERRIDLPTVGSNTVRRAAEAGLSGIAVEAGGTLILEREETVRLADEAGLFLYGFSPEEASDP